MLAIRDSRFQQPVSEDGIDNPLLRRLLGDWLAARPTPDGVPNEDFIDPFRLRYLVDSLIVVEVAPQAGGTLRYRYRLIGTELVSHTGRDQTGRWVDQHPEAELASTAAAVSNAVVEKLRPALLEFRRNFFGRYYPVAALVLPLGCDAAGRPTRLLVGQVYPKDAPRRPFGDSGM